MVLGHLRVLYTDHFQDTLGVGGVGVMRTGAKKEEKGNKDEEKRTIWGASKVKTKRSKKGGKLEFETILTSSIFFFTKAKVYVGKYFVPYRSPT